MNESERIAAGVDLQPDPFVFAGGQQFVGQQDFTATAVEREQVDLPRRIEIEHLGDQRRPVA